MSNWDFLAWLAAHRPTSFGPSSLAVRPVTTGRPALALMGGFVSAQDSDRIPAHPRDIAFPELDFTPPAGAEYRHELSNGVPVYVVPSHEFPLISLSFTFKGGEYLMDKSQAGLNAALGGQMRRGGTTTVKPDELDERLDFLAANLGTFVGGETSGASIDCLKANFDGIEDILKAQLEAVDILT